MARQQAQKPINERHDLIGAYVCSAVAAILIRYVASVGHPGSGHAVLALLAVAGVVAAYLLIARSDTDENQKAANIVGAAVIAGICFAIVSWLV